MTEKIERITAPLVMAPFISHWNLIGEMQEEATKEIAFDIRAWLPDAASMRPEMVESKTDPSWRELDGKTPITTALAYSQRLYPVHYVLEQSDPQNIHHYAEPELLALAEQKPVVLAFKWPVVAELVLLSLSEFPPPLIGHIAAIGGTKPAQFMEITQLPEKAQQLQKRLHEKLLALSEGKWVVIGDHMHLWLNGGLEEAQRRLQTEKRKEHRDLLKAGIAKMEEARDDWNAAIAAYQKRIDQTNYRDTWNEVRDMMQQLADEYAETHRIKSPPGVANRMSEGHIQAPSTKPVLSIVSALQHRNWTKDDQGMPRQQEGDYEVSVGPTRQQHLKTAPNEPVPDGKVSIFKDELWPIAQRLDDGHIDVLLMMLAQAWSPTYKDGVDTTISARQMLDYRLKERVHRGNEVYSGHRTDDIEKFSSMTEDLAHIRIRSTVVDLDSVRIPRGTEVNLIDIRQRWGQQRLDGSIKADQWAYQVGRWAMIMPGLSAQSAAIAQAVLAYDWYHDKWEKRLGYWALFRFRMSAAAGPINMTVEEVLQKANLEKEIDKRHPAQARRDFENALKQLADDRVIDAWGYSFQPQLARTGWLTTWLQWRVNIQAGSYITHHYAAIREKREKYRMIGIQTKANATAFANTRFKKKKPRKSPGKTKGESNEDAN